ncbi:MAG: hypothetical protein ACI83B_003035 [Sediminicola sp.]|jgi:hypothetical protein
MKKLAYQLSFILLFFLMGGTSVNSQILLREASLKKQIENSSLVVEGKVLSKKSFWNTENNNIYTSNVIEVYKVFKGQPIETIEVITEGGTIGLSAQIVIPSLKLNVNYIGVFMLYENNVNLKSKSSKKQFKTYGSLQGFYKYNLDSDAAVNPFKKKQGISSTFYKEIMSITKIDFVEVKAYETLNKQNKSSKNAVLVPGAITFTPATITAGTKSILTINGTGFGGSTGKVSFFNSDDGGLTFVDALGSQIKTWNNTQITVEVPSEAGTGLIKVTDSGDLSDNSSSSLTVSFSEINVIADNINPGTDIAYSVQHINDNTSGGYTFSLFTDFNTNINAKTAFIRVLDTWRCETGINWVIGPSTTTIDEAVGDGTNVVRFDNGTELETDVLGRFTSYYDGCVAGGGTTLNWYVSELDIVFDDAANWNFSSATNSTGVTQYDFESVTLHELGHGHQLGHVIDTDDVMNYAISNSEEQRALGSSNIVCASAIETRSTTIVPCAATFVMTNHPCYLSIEEEQLKDAISIYPNPSKGSFNIKNMSLINLEKVVIYDISGRLISEYNMTNSSRIKTINLVGVSKGMYFINIQSERGIITKKLVLE